MSKQTYQDFEQHLESYMLIDQKLRSIANKYADEFEGGGYVEGIEVDYDGVFGTVEVTGSIPTRCGCCSDDYMNFHFPLSYLWEDDWLEQEQHQREVEKQRKEEEEFRKKAEAKKAEAEAERKLYEKLKDKYE